MTIVLIFIVFFRFFVIILTMSFWGEPWGYFWVATTLNKLARDAVAGGGGQTPPL